MLLSRKRYIKAFGLVNFLTDVVMKFYGAVIRQRMEKLEEAIEYFSEAEALLEAAVARAKTKSRNKRLRDKRVDVSIPLALTIYLFHHGRIVPYDKNRRGIGKGLNETHFCWISDNWDFNFSGTLVLHYDEEENVFRMGDFHHRMFVLYHKFLEGDLTEDDLTEDIHVQVLTYNKLLFSMMYEGQNVQKTHNTADRITNNDFVIGSMVDFIKKLIPEEERSPIFTDKAGMPGLIASLMTLHRKNAGDTSTWYDWRRVFKDKSRIIKTISGIKVDSDQIYPQNLVVPFVEGINFFNDIFKCMPKYLLNKKQFSEAREAEFLLGLILCDRLSNAENRLIYDDPDMVAKGIATMITDFLPLKRMLTSYEWLVPSKTTMREAFKILNYCAPPEWKATVTKRWKKLNPITVLESDVDSIEAEEAAWLS
jgi:hypothetical protein